MNDGAGTPPGGVMRRVLYAVGGLIGLSVLFCVGDWVLWRVQGAATDQVTVYQMTVATLKGDKEAYYPDGSTVVPCARMLMPAPGVGAWIPPCWWLQKHRIVELRY